MTEAFVNALARSEQALAGALERVTVVGTPDEIERLVKLIIKKKIVSDMLLETIQSVVVSVNFGQTDVVHMPPNVNQLSDESQNRVVNHPDDVAVHQEE